MSCRQEFVYRPNDDGDQSIESRTALTMPPVSGSISGVCGTNRDSDLLSKQSGCFGTRRSHSDSFQLSFSEIAPFLSQGYFARSDHGDCRVNYFRCDSCTSYRKQLFLRIRLLKVKLLKVKKIIIIQESCRYNKLPNSIS